MLRADILAETGENHTFDHQKRRLNRKELFLIHKQNVTLQKCGENTKPE